MEKLLTLRRGFAVGEKNDPRDMETITEALRATGFLKRPTSGGKPPAQAEVGRALRDFQDREGLVVDGRAAPLGPTERHLSNAVQRAAVLAARPARTGPLRFQPITGEAAGALRRTANGLMRTGDHRGAVSLFRRAFEDDPEGGVPEAIHFAGLIERMDRKKGARFRGELVRMAEEVDPALARHIAAGEIVGGGSTRAGTSLLSPAGAGTKAGAGGGPAAGDPPTRARAQADGNAAATIDRIVPPTTPDTTRPAFERMARMTPEERRRAFVESADRQFHRFAREWRKDGYKWAAAFMENYLKGKGGTYGLTRDQARELAPIRDAEAENRGRVERSFVERMSPSGNPNPFYKAILTMISGKADVMATTNDRWQVAYKRGSLIRNFTVGDTDFARAFGQLGVNAFVTAEAAFDGGKIVVKGTVEHWLIDRYDFGGSEYGYAYSYAYERQAAALEEAGRARQFDVGAGWKQRFNATIEIVEGKPRIERFDWVDTEELVDWRNSKIVADQERDARQTTP